jgi:hypothetical protein
MVALFHIYRQKYIEDKDGKGEPYENAPVAVADDAGMAVPKTSGDILHKIFVVTWWTKKQRALPLPPGNVG